VQSQGIGADRIILVRNGSVVLDVCFYPFAASSVHDVASVTKSITSLAVGIAIDKGFLKGTSESVRSFFPERKAAGADENWKSLRIEHLLTMTSGLCRNLDEGEEQTGRMSASSDGLQYMLERPLASKPGSDFVYCSLGPHLLSAILTRACGMSLQAFAEKNLFAPLGIKGAFWEADPQGNSHGWGDLYIRPMDLTKIGYLLLKEGRWQGRQIVSREWVRASAKPKVFESGGTGYGFLWWVPKEPAGLYEGRGRGGQRLAVWPEKNMVVVLVGSGG
jgi:CubicO group peptidase (beta-lactamase class C family)